MKFRPLLVALAVTLLALPAAATSYVMVSDENLVGGASAVVQARVLSVDAAPGAGMPSTDYLIEVDRVLAGDVAGRNLVVRVPGGVRPDGMALKLYGMPEFLPGETVLLFLKPGQQGTYRLYQLMLGAFHEVVVDGERLLARNLSGARELSLPGRAPGAAERFHRPRRADAFRRWISERARGGEPRAEYFADLSAQGVGSVTGEYRLFDDDRTGRNLRWFDFDDGDFVEWRVQAGGATGYNNTQTRQAFNEGANGWNTDNGSIVDYRYAGTTGNTDAFSGCGRNDCTDEVNSIVFEDVDGSINDAFSCSQGGTLALGGPWYSNLITERAPDGQLYHPIGEAEIVLNAGIDCFLTFNQAGVLGLGQLLGHELGHTLGIDHPCGGVEEGCPQAKKDALMYAFYQTGRGGAFLEADDRAAVRFLYPGSAAVRPDPPTGLGAELLSPTEVELTWTDNADDEQSYLVQSSTGGGFGDVGTFPADTESVVVEDLEPDTLYTFRVQARNAAGGSAYATVQVETPPEVPLSPTAVSAIARSETSVTVAWRDMSDDETGFVIEARRASVADWFVVRDGIAPDSEAAEVTGLEAMIPYAFRVRARNDEGLSLPSEPVAATPVPGDLSTGCSEAGGAICLLDDRFQVSVEFRNQHAADDFGSATGQRFDGSDRTGSFWFFRPDNVELLVKMLDGGPQGFFWTFHGALSDVEYWITVVDTQAGISRTYYNPPSDRCGRFDTTSLPNGPLPAGGQSSGVAVPSVSSLATPAATPRPGEGVFSGEGEPGPCEADDTTLCLLDGRFEVSVDWVDQHNDNRTGVGHAVAEGVQGGDRTGYFWFFDASNIELAVKALDDTGGDTSSFWFFYGSLSDVNYTITVRDTVSGDFKGYVNEPGEQCGQFDTGAFPIADEETPDDPVVGS